MQYFCCVLRQGRVPECLFSEIQELHLKPHLKWTSFLVVFKHANCHFPITVPCFYTVPPFVLLHITLDSLTLDVMSKSVSLQSPLGFFPRTMSVASWAGSHSHPSLIFLMTAAKEITGHIISVRDYNIISGHTIASSAEPELYMIHTAAVLGPCSLR